MLCYSGAWSGFTNDELDTPPASVVGVPPRTNCYRCRAGFGDTRCRGIAIIIIIIMIVHLI